MNNDLMSALTALKSDPAIAAALAKGDLRTLMGDPRLQSALTAMQNSTPAAEAETLAKNLLDTPAGAGVRQMLEQL